MREALVESTRSLLAERSPRAISGREIAARAGVNYGQIHHQFGPKDALFAEALRRNAAAFLRDDMDGGTREPVPIVIDRADGLWRTLAHLALDRTSDRPPADTVMQQFLRLRSTALGLPVTHLEVRSQVASVIAIQFGWGLFDRVITSGLGVPVDHQQLATGVARRSARLVDQHLIEQHATLIREPSRPEPQPPRRDGLPAPAPGRGPDRVRSRLIDAARQLLSEKSPTDIRGRELAARAGVNYGQIHHYFGTLDNLFQAALTRNWDHYVEDHMSDADPTRPACILTDQISGVWETAARRALDDHAGTDATPVPTLVRRRHLIAAQWHAESDDPGVVEASAAFAAMQYGWGVFERLILGGLTIPDGRSNAVRRRARELSRLLTLAT